MSKYLDPRLFVGVGLVLAGLAVSSAAYAEGHKFGLGRVALDEEITAWDLDISPDGTGLPVGSGSVELGEELFSDYCAICHGDFAEGVDNWPKLSGGMDTLNHEDPLKTIGSYWPYLTTTLDYVNRSMPFGSAQSLTIDEVYAVVAYIVYSNDLVEEDFVLSNENLLAVEMPNAGGFIVDDRPESEYPQFSVKPCMSECKPTPVEITMRAAVLDVTPGETKARQIREMVEATNPANRRNREDEPEVVELATIQEPIVDLNMELVANGETLFKKCKVCHQVGEGASNKIGPALNGIVGAVAGAAEGFRYSRAMKGAAEDGLVWSPDELAAFLTKPRAYLRGTKMSFAGFRDESDTLAIIEYLKAFEN